MSENHVPDEPDRSQPPTEPPRPGGTTWTDLLISLRWPLVIIVLAVAVLLVYVWTVGGAADLAEEIGQGVVQVGEQLDSIAESFRTGTITETFVSALPELTAGGSGKLELATATSTETFNRTDELRVLWDWVSLGETVVEIRVPVTYRYHLRMDDPWRLQISGQTCIVHAPQIRPSLPPAIHTDRMQKRTQSDWLRFDAEQQLEELERSITPTLVATANDPLRIANVREECRDTVAGFVRNWLLDEDHWRDDRFHNIVVLFADETDLDPEFQPPTLSLER